MVLPRKVAEPGHCAIRGRAAGYTPGMSLRHKLADFGFESNDDYDYALRCLFEAELPHLRVLHVDGQGGRRKTAFAQALAQALEYPHILYHDFSRPEPPPAPVVNPDGTPALEPGLSAFERVVTEACAFSEGARAILILDQLQAAPFAEQMRLTRFAAACEWSAGSASVLANPRNLLLVLISEEPLYHSLARLSYRVWADAEKAFLDYRPEDYGLPADARPLFEALAELFASLGAAPTPTEFGRLLADLLLRVRSEDQLRQSLFGWTETVQRARLFAPGITPLLRQVIDRLTEFLGVDQVELSAGP